MINGWEKETINDVALVGDGAHASIKRVDKGVLYLTSKNFDLNGLKLSKVDYISKEDYLKYFKEDSKALTKPRKGDILLSIIGSMGAAHLVNNDDDFGLSSSVSILRPNTNIIPAFLLYWIKGQYFQESIKGIKSGVAQSFLSLAMIRSLPCINPPLPTQQKIASILSAYDDLIENNTKRIELLEKQAQLIYEEWFVRMKFPNHENTKIDAETGLPKGWEYKKIESLVEVTSSKRIFLSDYVENGIPFFRGKEIILKSKNEPLNDRLYITREKFNTIRKKFGVPTTGDVLITAVGTLGYPYLVTEDDGDFYFKDGNLIWLKNDNKIISSYLISCFKNENFKARLNNIAIGSSQKALTIKSIKDLKMLLPNEGLLESFNKMVQPRFELISKLQVQNRYLKEARDILLPRLMMGIIEV